MTLRRRSHYDLIVMGAGPAGSAAAIAGARGGASVLLVEKGQLGRDKVCGDGLTPRAMAALDDLKIELDRAHRIDGLRMIAGNRVRALDWPTTSQFPSTGAVWPRRRLDAALAEAAEAAGAEIIWETEALPSFDDDGNVIGVQLSPSDERITADLIIAATGAPGQAARMLGATRVPDETFGLAIRTYVESPRHAENLIEACLTIEDSEGRSVPGYGWMFPAGDGTVNLGVGALSTMKGFKKLNLNTLLDSYRNTVRDSWEIGPNLERPRAWRLPMTAQRRHGPGWVAIGDAAGLVNPMNGEGIDYGLESGILAAELFLANPATAAERYDAEVGVRFDEFLRMGRRFSLLIGHPMILRQGLRFALSTDAVARITLGVMANIVDEATPGSPGAVLRLASRGFAVADPLLRKTRATP